MMTHTVGQVAKLAKVSVRTLHHYEALGLLAPSARSTNGYRLYSRTDLERLQQILFYRELGFPLKAVKGLLDDPAKSRLGIALPEQRQLLLTKAEQLKRMAVLIEQEIEAAHKKGETMAEEEMFEVFGDFDPKQYQAEVQERFDPALVAESKRRSVHYSKEDWKRIPAEGDAISTALAERMPLGPEDAQVQTLVARHYHHINDNFYSCSLAMYTELAELYISDLRFTAYYERRAVGLAEFTHQAMLVWVQNQSAR